MKTLRDAFLILLLLTLITGGVYPLLVTLAAQALFPHAAGGSLIVREGRVLGSELIGRPFDAPGDFWPRPSAAPRGPYAASLSGGSNLGPTNAALAEAVRARAAALRAADPADQRPIPVDLVTASGSGLDPHISPASAERQVPRVARARGLAQEGVRELVARHTQGRWLGVFGDPGVNVLQLNLALDALGALADDEGGR
jgi:potassium-transporting ATPase KdpC subunit